MANNPNDPICRVTRSTALTLSTTWQKVDFSGTSTRDRNTFGIDPVSGMPMIYWDTTNKMFKFMGDKDINCTCFLFLATTTNLVTTRASLQYRFVTPNGLGAGVNDYFPFPDAGGYGDIGEITIVTSQQNNRPVPIPLYESPAIRTNGCWLELRLSNSLISLGICTLNYATMLIQTIGK